MNYKLFALLALPLLLFGCLGEEKAQKQEVPKYTFPEDSPIPTAPPSTEPEQAQQFKIIFFDVGFGDATLITDGKVNILFDTGPSETSKNVISSLRKNNVESFDLLILSSNQPDNVGAAPELMLAFPVKEIWHNGVDYDDALYGKIKFNGKYSEWVPVEYGYKKTIGNITLTVINPQKDRALLSSGLDSIAIKVEYGSFCALLFSDSEASGAVGNDGGTVIGGIDAKIVSGNVPLQCPVLKVANHGSGNAASFQLLEEAKPEVGIISSGPHKVKTLPEPVLIERLLLKHMEVYRTDVSGTITLESDGKDYSIKTERPAPKEE